MKSYKQVLEKEDIYEYLSSRGLIKQYEKAKTYIIAGHGGKLDLKERQPKGSGVFTFRINKQFRAFCIEDDSDLIVFKIDNHQNY